METDSTSVFDYIVYTGAGFAVLGMLGLIWCIFKVIRAKRANLTDDALRDAVKAVVPLNLGSLLLSALGLMMVIIGISLG